MSALTSSGGEQPPEKGQSGMQIWLVCLLFIVLPVLLILAIKHLFGL